jgi:hypothetical protein
LSKHLVDHIDQSTQVLDKLEKRLKSCTHRKPSQVLTYFAFAQNVEEQPIHLNEGLTNFGRQLKELLAKFLAVHDYSEIDEQHEKKHSRLFTH